MKKLAVIALVVGLIGVLSVGAYAHWGDEYGRRGGMMSGRRGGSGRGWMGGRGFRGGSDASAETCPCGGTGPQGWGWQRWNTPDQSGKTQQAPQIVSEDKVKEAAEAYVKEYLPGYTVDKIEKDNWRPLYFVTIKGENNVEQLMTVHGFSGQVMHVFPKPAPQPEQQPTQ